MVGISKRKRKRQSNVNKNDSKRLMKNISPQNKSISDLFSDFDLSDIKVNFNFGNNSFKSTKSLINSETFNDENESINCSVNSSVFNSNLEKNLKSNSKTPFKSLKNGFNSNDKKSVTSATKSKSCSVFNDFDLSDLNFDANVTSFQSSRKVRTETSLISNSSNYLNNRNDCNHQKEELSNNSLEDEWNDSIPDFNLQTTEPLTPFIFNNLSDNQNCDPNPIIPSKTSDENQINSFTFKSISSHLNQSKESYIQLKSEDLDKNDSKIDTKVCEEDSKNGLSVVIHKVFKDFDLSDLKLSDSNDSFKIVSKVIETDNNLVNTKGVSKLGNNSSILSDSKFSKSFSFSENMRKSIITNIFDDIDLKDIKFTSNNSFENSRTALQSLNLSEINPIIDTIDWNEMNSLFNQSFGESQEFRTSSPKPNRICLSDSVNPKSSSPKPKSKISQEMEFSFEIDDQFFDSCLERTEQTNVSSERTENNLIKSNIHSEDSLDSLQDISFTLRTDFATYNELSSEEFFAECGDQYIQNQNQSCLGFHSGRGQPIHISEQQLSSAKLIFKDIEEWLITQIINSKQEFKTSERNSFNYSHKFVSNDSKRGEKSDSILNNLPKNDSIESFAQLMGSLSHF